MDTASSQNRQYKDRLFKAIFGRDTEESKRWRLELYNALNGTNYTEQYVVPHRFAKSRI